MTADPAGGSSRPALIVVSGPPGAGKTTLAREIARAVGCPAVCRDEIREGMAHASLERLRTFDRVSLDVPSLEVDTTSGYRPGLAEIAAVAAGRG